MGSSVEVAIPFPTVDVENRQPPEREEVELTVRGIATAVAPTGTPDGLTPASPENAQCGFVQGQKQCKHLWITAIDRSKLASGTADPSSAPFFIPGQTLAAQYVSPLWTKAVIAPPQ